MLIAVSDVVWQAAIGAVVTIVLAWMAQRTKDAVEKTGKDAADKVDEVKVDLLEANKAADKKMESEFSAVKTAVEEVHKATNGMKHELVEEVRKASFAAGEKSEKDKDHKG